MSYTNTITLVIYIIVVVVHCVGQNNILSSCILSIIKLMLGIFIHPKSVKRSIIWQLFYVQIIMYWFCVYVRNN